MDSKLYICQGIKLDKNYTNVLNYTLNQMLELVVNKSVYETNNLNYIDYIEKTIKINCPYSIAIESNYLAFQNPRHGNKWYFAFIDDVKYESPNQCTVSFTIDVWSTFYNDWTQKPCFVVREHVNDDTIGIHTVPENLEHGEYVCNYTYNVDMGTMYIVVGTTMAYETKVKGGLYGGTYSGIQYLYWPITEYLYVNEFLNYMDEHAHADAIVSIFMAPDFIVHDLLDPDHIINNGTTIASQTEELIRKRIPGGTTTDGKLDGYKPKNNKLYVYPYNYLLVSNNTGGASVYRYEFFNEIRSGYETACLFDMYGVLCPGGSIKLVPKHYKGQDYNYEESINAGKFPVCSWNTDVYINWLTQNSINIELQNVNDIMQIGQGTLSMLTGNIAGGTNQIIGAEMSMANTMATKYVHSLVPPQARGNVNAGDVLRGKNKNTFTFMQMSIRSEYLKQLDDYFSREGYQINETKIANITGRTYWNYIQIGSEEIIGTGNVASKYMEEINNICRKGVTIWHNHENIGNYNLNNTIVS